MNMSSSTRPFPTSLSLSHTLSYRSPRSPKSYVTPLEVYTTTLLSRAQRTGSKRKRKKKEKKQAVMAQSRRLKVPRKRGSRGQRFTAPTWLPQSGRNRYVPRKLSPEFTISGQRRRQHRVQRKTANRSAVSPRPLQLT